MSTTRPIASSSHWEIPNKPTLAEASNPDNRATKIFEEQIGRPAQRPCFNIHAAAPHLRQTYSAPNMIEDEDEAYESRPRSRTCDDDKTPPKNNHMQYCDDEIFQIEIRPTPKTNSLAETLKSTYSRTTSKTQTVSNPLQRKY